MESIRFSYGKHYSWLFGPLSINPSGDFYIDDELIGSSIFTPTELRDTYRYREEQLDPDLEVDDVF